MVRSESRLALAGIEVNEGRRARARVLGVVEGPWTHRFVEARDVRFHLVEAGRGPLVVLLHGFPECWYSWRHQIPRLAEHFHVVAPDMRGYNETSKPRDGYDVASLVEDVLALARALGHERFGLVGHDWGGVVAWAAAARHPERVTRLAIVNAPHPTLFVRALRSSPAQMLRSWYVLLFQIPGLAEWLFRRDGGSFVDRVIRGNMVRPELVTDDDLAVYRAAILRPRALESALAYYRRAFRDAVRDRAAVRNVTVRVPTRVVWGERDRALGVELLDGLDRYVPELVVQRFPNASHWLQQDEPELVTDALLEHFHGHLG